MEDRPQICDVRGRRRPAAPHATYWVPGHRWFHLCRGHWDMVGDGRDELGGLLGVEPDARETP
jgi:hypothetical protein